MVVDSPPGMTRASTASSSAGRRTVVPRAPACSRADRCSRTSPWTARTPMVGWAVTTRTLGRAGTPAQRGGTEHRYSQRREHPSATDRRTSPVLARVLAAQRPHSGYPQRWPLPMPVEEFLQRAERARGLGGRARRRVVGHVAVARCAARRHGAPDLLDLPATEAGRVDTSCAARGASWSAVGTATAVGRGADVRAATSACSRSCRGRGDPPWLPRPRSVDVVQRRAEAAARRALRRTGWQVRRRGYAASWLPAAHLSGC